MKRIISGLLAAIMLLPGIQATVQATEETASTVNINNPTADKNWYTNYKESYTPASTRPKTAPAAIGIRSISSSAGYDYKQSFSSLKAQADRLYVNSFKELFAPSDQRYLNNLVATAEEQTANSTSTGNKALDSYKSKPYPGLTENEIKWLINNNIVSRDPNYLKIEDREIKENGAGTGITEEIAGRMQTVITLEKEDSLTGENELIVAPAVEEEVQYDDAGSVKSIGMDPLFTMGKDETMKKSDFLMALHKGTYGILESRPLVFDIIPYRWAQKVTWELDKDTFNMKIDNKDEENTESSIADLVYQPVLQADAIKAAEKEETERLERRAEAEAEGREFTELEIDDRGEFITRLQGDTNYVVATFPEKDKMFITSPNVVELYIKSLIDKGIISTANLVKTSSYNSNSKNALKNSEELSEEFLNYGQIDNTTTQKYPAYAPEIGPLDNSDTSHTFFKVDKIGSTGPWGRRYNIDMKAGTIEIVKNEKEETADFFLVEEMTTMDALKFIEAIMRTRESDMTDTEAKIVSYKYGVTFIDSLEGSDRSTVMYLTAKGILNFEDFDEYRFLYEKLEKVFAYTLLYRVANPAARKNMTEIQLTDSDHFWMGKGFGSYAKTIRVPDTSAVQSYKGVDGGLVVDASSEKVNSDPNKLQLAPFVETVSIIATDPSNVLIENVKRMTEILEIGLQGEMTQALADEYFALEASTKELKDKGINAATATAVTYLDGNIPVYHAENVDIFANIGEDRYNNIDFLTKPEETVPTFASILTGKSPFGAPDAEAVADTKAMDFAITKVFDDIYKYLFKDKPIMAGVIPTTKAEKQSGTYTVDEKVRANFKESVLTEGSNIITLTKSEDGIIDLTPLLHKDCSNLIKSVKYHTLYDRYDVVFETQAMTTTAALQEIDTNLKTTTDTLTKDMDIQVVSKYTKDGKEIILIPQSALVNLDPDLVVLGSKTLMNNRTGAKAFLLTDENLAMIGNKIVAAPEGTMMVEATDNEIYYNLEIISSLLPNSALAKIGEKEFYNNISIHDEKVRDVVSGRGDVVATALTGEYERYATTNIAEGTTAVETQEFTETYINLSQMTTGSNLIMKDFVQEIEKTETTGTKSSGGETGFKVTYTVVVEWKLILPGAGEIDKYLKGLPLDASKNPTIDEINMFYYTRPAGTGSKELQDYWDSNMAINNAIANVMYETTGKSYINCGYLVPEISLLFDVDTGNADKNEQLSTENMQLVVGMWFQEVGQQIDKTWVDKFFGSYNIYNKIISRGSGDDPNHYSNFKDDLLLVYSKGAVLTVDEAAILEKEAGFNETYGTVVNYRLKANNIEQERREEITANIPFTLTGNRPEIQLADGSIVEITVSSSNNIASIANRSTLSVKIQNELETNKMSQTMLADGTLLLIKDDLSLATLQADEDGIFVEVNKTTVRYYTLEGTEWVGGVYYNEKPLNFDWFPAWMHAAFNNPHRNLAGLGGGTEPTTPAGVTTKNGELWRKLDVNRIFNYYPRKERRSSGTVYGYSGADDVAWVKLPSGAIYKSIGAKSGYTLSGENVVAETRGSGLSDVTNISEYSGFVGNIVTFTVNKEATQYYISRFDQQYLELISIDAVEGYCGNGSFTLEGNSLLEEAYSALTDRFIGSPYDAEYAARANSVDDFRVLSNVLPDSYYKRKDEEPKSYPYLITDSTMDVQVKKWKEESVGGVVRRTLETLAPIDYNNMTVRYHPVIRLSVFSWDVTYNAGTDEYYLHYRRVIPAMLFSGLYQSSMTQAMVDSLISRSVGYIPIEDVPVGSTVLFGDTILYRDRMGFITAPIRAKYSADLPAISGGNTVTNGDVVAAALRIFNIALDSNGTVETVADYIQAVSLAPKSSTGKFVYSNTMVAKDLTNRNTVFIATAAGSEAFNQVNRPTSVSYLLEFSTGLKVLPLSEDEKSYSLLFSTSESGRSPLTQLPVFGSDTDYYISSRVELEAFSSNFKPLPNQAELKKGFQEEVNLQAAKDVKYWVKMVLSYVLAYLMIMTTLMFFGLRNVTFSSIIDKIKHPSGGGRGPDLVQIATIGIMSNDQELSGQRLFISLLLLATIFAILTII